MRSTHVDRLATHTPALTWMDTAASARRNEHLPDRERLLKADVVCCHQQ
ncbi:hypothetical protein AB0J25_08910 [Streptomyces sp. NPDC049910]